MKIAGGRSYPEPENSGSLRSVATAAKSCRACELWKTGTQTVFGEGPRNASVMFVGEQPGDVEDKRGEPFVGPAGCILDEALVKVGIDRTRVYVTNAVKHFKWKAKGKRRIHEKPNASEVAACRHWLELELRLVRLRSAPLVTRIVATVHPSSILRAPDETRDAELAAFVKDLGAVKRLMDARPVD